MKAHIRAHIEPRICYEKSSHQELNSHSFSLKLLGMSSIYCCLESGIHKKPHLRRSFLVLCCFAIVNLYTDYF